jgi:hypothetical protein
VTFPMGSAGGTNKINIPDSPGCLFDVVYSPNYYESTNRLIVSVVFVLLRNLL